MTDVFATKRDSVFQIFLAFLCLGLTSFGGPAMIPHVRRLAVGNRKWLSEEDFKFGMSVCQLVPGATVMQLAAYVGMRTAGLRGAFCAFVGFAFPAFVLITMLSAVYFRFQNLPQLLAVFSGLKTVVAAVIVHSSLEMCSKYLPCLPERLLAVAAALCFAFGVHPILTLAGAVLVAILFWTTPVQAMSCQRRAPWKDTLLIGCGLVLFLLLLRLLSVQSFDLAWLMMRIDAMAFGGGYASLPIMMHEVVERLQWLPRDVLMDGIALGQLTPGPIVITAAFVGYAKLGVWGALIGTIAVFSPSFFFLIAIMPGCDRLFGSAPVRRGLQGCLVSLAGLMAGMSAKVLVLSSWSSASVLLALASFIALRRRVGLHWVIALGAIWGALTF